MLFALSKIFGGLIRPVSLLLAALLAALLLQRSRPRASRIIIATCLVTLAMLHLAPGAYWIVHPLETRFPSPVLPDHVDGIVVLGGAIETVASDRIGQPQLTESAERITAAVDLQRRYPQAQLLFTGGSGMLASNSSPEADVARVLFDSLGLNTKHILFERESRNTWENALDSMQLAHPRAGETWLLVTSAWHMPRAVGCFRKAGWPVTPYPVDYFGPEVSQWLGFDGDLQIRIATFALKEWAGLIAYHLLGRTDALFPSPTVPPA